MKLPIQRNIPAHIRELLTKHKDLSLYTAEEKKQLVAWYESLDNAGTVPSLDDDELERTEKEIIWQHIRAASGLNNAPVQSGGRRIRLHTWLWKGAAAVLCAAILGAGWHFFLRGNKPGNNRQMVTNAGTVRQLTLPDGSQVWLNANSLLEYNAKWDNKVREVRLTGEAFFEVAEKANQPFTIHTKTVDVKVLGTAFNIKAYPEDLTTETTLLSGKVAVILKQEQGKTVQLQPSQKLVVQNLHAIAGGKTPLQNGDNGNNTAGFHIARMQVDKTDSTIIETSWREHKLAFFNERFDEIAGKLERWYGVKVLFANEAMKRARFTATFRNETLQRVMEALQLSASFNFEINKDTVTINK